MITTRDLKVVMIVRMMRQMRLNRQPQKNNRNPIPIRLKNQVMKRMKISSR